MVVYDYSGNSGYSGGYSQKKIICVGPFEKSNKIKFEADSAELALIKIITFYQQYFNIVIEYNDISLYDKNNINCKIWTNLRSGEDLTFFSKKKKLTEEDQKLFIPGKIAFDIDEDEDLIIKKLKKANETFNITTHENLKDQICNLTDNEKEIFINLENKNISDKMVSGIVIGIINGMNEHSKIKNNDFDKHITLNLSTNYLTQTSSLTYLKIILRNPAIRYINISMNGISNISNKYSLIKTIEEYPDKLIWMKINDLDTPWNKLFEDSLLSFTYDDVNSGSSSDNDIIENERKKETLFEKITNAHFDYYS